MAMALNGSGNSSRPAAHDWRAVAGLSSMYIWTWLLYWGGALSLRSSTMELVNIRWGANVVACAAACGLAALAVRRWRTGAQLTRILHYAGPACCLVGTLLSVWLVLDTTPEGPLFAAAAIVDGVFTGVGEGFLLCLWCKVTSSAGVRSALLYNVIALAAGGLIFLACNVAPPWVSFTASALCSVAGFVCSRPGALRELEASKALAENGSAGVAAGTAADTAGSSTAAGTLPDDEPHPGTPCRPRSFPPNAPRACSWPSRSCLVFRAAS